jgi:hypothetical protein
VKYSKQHEFGFSTMVSVGTHVLVALIAFAAGAAFWSWNSDRDLPTVVNLDVVPTDVGDDKPGGGGIEGKDKRTTGSIEEVELVPTDEPLPPPPPLPSLEPDGPAVDVIKLRDQRKTPATNSAGKDGGERGGEGGGFGPNKGKWGGPRPPIRPKRMERWEISVAFSSGEDYLRKLGNLGAKIGIPQANGTYAVYSNLDQRPLRGEPHTTTQIRILGWLYWANDDPNAVPALAEAMGLSLPPKRLYVFFPKDLEAELVKKEMAHSGLTEQQLNEQGYYTTFRAERQGTKWVIAVIKQEKRK